MTEGEIETLAARIAERAVEKAIPVIVEQVIDALKRTNPDN